MGICRDAGNTLYPEVKWGKWVTSLVHENYEKTPQTGIYMQRDVVANSKLENNQGKVSKTFFRFQFQTFSALRCLTLATSSTGSMIP